MANSVIFRTKVVKAVPNWQEGDSNKETERAAQVRYEGDGGVSPDFPLWSSLGGGEGVHEQEVTEQISNKLINSKLSLKLTCLRISLDDAGLLDHPQALRIVCIPAKYI